MTVWQHHREHDHSGTEDCSTVQLSEAVGRYPAGSLVCDVIDDMVIRLENLDADYAHGFVTFGLDAYLAPYAPNGALNGFFTMDAVIRKSGTGTYGLDAVLEAPELVTNSGQFGLGSYFVPLFNDAITVLVQPVGPGDTVIYVENGGDFPIPPFLIQIGIETMTVVSVVGNTWTVQRTNPTSHPVGAYVVVC